jgi:hypothetical protein
MPPKRYAKQLEGKGFKGQMLTARQAAVLV